ncbi:MFS transporter [Galdieria sulphuraria]|uniref:MFS transporter n=1 Tax=Galdieria sulphuraria TaxID=130081 RepID=M2WYX2_GALSU|nr:MFS transporter [Galdieria sulphuraria]EME29260.1 MFS transporter [Galdieria sulphuraria]|eukprot:XP_005705780.1 MFS transporter [Galdieria sulphuraria]
MSISNVGSGSLWTHFKQPERWSRDGIYRLSGCCFMSFFGLGLVIGLLGPALPPLAEALSLKQAESLGFLFTVRGVGYFLGSLLFGFIGKKLSYRSLIAGGCLILALTQVLIAVSTSTMQLGLFCFLVGFFSGFVDTGGNAAVGSLLAEDPLADTFMQALHFSFGLGAFSAPLLTALLLKFSGSIALAFFLVGLLCLCIGLSFLGLTTSEICNKPTTKELTLISEEERWMDASVENNTTVQATPSTPPPQSNRKLLLVLVAFAAFFYVGCEIGFGGWIATYSLNSHSVSTKASAALMASVFWASFTIGRLVSIPLSLYLSCRSILFLDLSQAIVSTIFGILGFNLWFCSSLVGFALSSSFPSSVTLIQSKTSVDQVSTSCLMVGASLGEILIPFLLGESMKELGLEWYFPLCLVTVCLWGLGFILVLIQPSHYHDNCTS